MQLNLINEKVIINGRKKMEIDTFEIDSVALQWKKNRIIKYIIFFYISLLLILMFPIRISNSILFVYFVGLISLYLLKTKSTKIYLTFKCKANKVKILLNKEDLEIAYQLIDLVRLNNFKRYTS